jgi:carboxypeptidase D
VLPGVIDRTENVILGHGAKDFLVLPDATLLTIQNLTWGGAMGFREAPAGVLFVPGHGGNGSNGGNQEGADVTGLAGVGVVGSSHHERGLTWFGAALAGHLLAMDQPAVAFRMVEVLLGRVEGFESTVPFTVDMGNGWNGAVGDLGNGTVKVGCEET